MQKNDLKVYLTEVEGQKVAQQDLKSQFKLLLTNATKFNSNAIFKPFEINLDQLLNRIKVTEDFLIKLTNFFNSIAEETSGKFAFLPNFFSYYFK